MYLCKAFIYKEMMMEELESYPSRFLGLRNILAIPRKKDYLMATLRTLYIIKNIIWNVYLAARYNIKENMLWSRPSF